MSFDTTCRRLAEIFPEDFASWLLGYRVPLTELSPTELSIEPIRADRVILLQGQAEILHIEFQTDPDDDIPMRLVDYRLRLHRKFPDKTIHQVVIYLRETKSQKVYQNYFEIAGMYAEFNVLRIWEVDATALMQFPGMLPFAALGRSENAEQTLRQAVDEMLEIEDESQQHEAIAAAYVLSGLKLEESVIARIIRRDVMRESVTYQAILREGQEVGREEKQQEIALNLLREGISIDIISRSTGLSIAVIQEIQQQLEQS